MYRKPRFLEMLHEIREEMSRDADYDVELFAEMVRSNQLPRAGAERNIRGFKSRAPRREDASDAAREAENKLAVKRSSSSPKLDAANVVGESETVIPRPRKRIAK